MMSLTVHINVGTERTDLSDILAAKEAVSVGIMYNLTLCVNMCASPSVAPRRVTVKNYVQSYPGCKHECESISGPSQSDG